MTQEEKQLLLKDLCTRLPYGVKVNITNEWFYDEIEPYDRRLDCDVIKSIRENRYTVKPYLRPMSSMTEEEQRTLDSMCNGVEMVSRLSGLKMFDKAFDWLNANHFNYRLPPHLFIEAPEGMYNEGESRKGRDIPVPKTVDEAISTLEKILSDEDREYLLKNGAISMHDSLGRWIRNEWGLWTGSELKNELKKKGFEHPDDMSNYIIEEFVKYWNNKV